MTGSVARIVSSADLTFKNIIIDVPGGPEKQQWCAIFDLAQGSISAGPTPYQISQHESLLPEGLRGRVHAPEQDYTRSGGEVGNWFMCAHKYVKPAIVLRASGGLLSIAQAAYEMKELTDGFDLIGLRMDRFVRYLPKRLLVDFTHRQSPSGKRGVLLLTAVELKLADLHKAAEETWGGAFDVE